MGITFGDHLIDSGYYDITPEQERERDNAEMGIVWWNALNDKQRKHWMERAGNTGCAVDAWRAFRNVQEADRADEARHKALEEHDVLVARGDAEPF